MLQKSMTTGTAGPAIVPVAVIEKSARRRFQGPAPWGNAGVVGAMITGSEPHCTYLPKLADSELIIVVKWCDGGGFGFALDFDWVRFSGSCLIKGNQSKSCLSFFRVALSCKKHQERAQFKVRSQSFVRMFQAAEKEKHTFGI
jgi:hypothetical protein